MAVGCAGSDIAAVCCLVVHEGPTKEITMLAIVAAVLFLVALVFELGSLVFGPVGGAVFVTAGLLCLALQLAGVGRRI
jgi:hypothetical protein